MLIPYECLLWQPSYRCDFLYDKALNIPNLLYMEEDFNIRDAECDLSISSYLAARQVLRDLAGSYSPV